MKTKSLFGYMPKFVFVSGVMFFSSSLLNAWTIQVLDPASTYSAVTNCYNGPDYTTFRSYLTATGSSLTLGSLASYTIGDADAVIVNVVGSSSHYSSAELSVLSSLLNSNTRVLVFGENNSWNSSNGELASLLGGVNGNREGANTQTVSNLYPLITEGVNSLTFTASGVISPGQSSGVSLSSDNSLTLWGNNSNFLLLMDINLLDNPRINQADNNKLAGNIANWLSGVDITPIPEPSSYALVMGMAGLGALAIRRRRK